MWNCPPTRLLVPVDFGLASGHAITVAAAIAGRQHAVLELLHAEQLEAPPYFTHEQVGALERQREEARGEARKYLAEFGRAHGALSATVHLVDGEPVPAITAASAGADLVVMGTHGRKGPTRWLMGSVAERVVHDSSSPVLVVRADAPPAERIFARPLVVAPHVGGDEAVRVARGLAQVFGGEVAARTATCEADIAAQSDASLIVVSKLIPGRSRFAHPVEQWLRNCTLPMLFVPAPVEVAAA